MTNNIPSTFVFEVLGTTSSKYSSLAYLPTIRALNVDRYSTYRMLSTPKKRFKPEEFDS